MDPVAHRGMCSRNQVVLHLFENHMTWSKNVKQQINIQYTYIKYNVLPCCKRYSQFPFQETILSYRGVLFALWLSDNVNKPGDTAN